MKRIVPILFFWIGWLCMHGSFAQAQIRSSTNGVTVVSDTTDIDDSVVYSDEDSDAAQVITSNDWGLDCIYNINHHLFDFFGVSTLGMFIACVIGLVLIVLAPILLIAFVLYLLLRKRNGRTVGARRQVGTVVMEDETCTSNEKKENAILHIAIGVGISLAMYILDIFGSSLGMAIGVLIACYGIGELVNACRRGNQGKRKN